MTLIEQKAQELSVNTVPEPSNDPNAPREFAIMTVISVISLIMEFIKLYQSCHPTPVKAFEAMQNLGPIENVRKRQVIRQNRRKTSSSKSLDKSLEENLDKMSKNLTQEEFTQMWKESKTIKVYDN